MKGLSVRWSLTESADDAAEQLATYGESSSHARFTGMVGLRHKTWRCRPGEWFEGTYVFVSDESRAQFQHTFAETAAESPGSQIVGASPVLIEEWDVVAVAEGWDGFQATPRA